jgi:hypothetical protein
MCVHVYGWMYVCVCVYIQHVWKLIAGIAKQCNKLNELKLMQRTRQNKAPGEVYCCRWDREGCAWQ